MDMFKDIISVLLKKSATVKEREEAYDKFSSTLKSSKTSLLTEVIKKNPDVFESIISDIRDGDTAVAQAALQFLAFVVHTRDIIQVAPDGKLGDILEALSQVIIRTGDKVTCTRALRCLSTQSLDSQIINDKLAIILEAIEVGQCKKNHQSRAVEQEALNAVIRLLEQVPAAMAPHAAQWGKLIYPVLLHGAVKLREQAVVAMELGLPAMLKADHELADHVGGDLKALLISEMKKWMSLKHENYVLKIWGYYVMLLGKLLHHGLLINHMLPVVESGFKHPSAETKCCAYKAWEILIDNFALDPVILGDLKRIKLLMQVFKINNAKLEPVAMEKLRVWWHLVCRLGDKASFYFDLVVVPLLQFGITGSVAPPVGTTAGKAGARTPTVAKLVGAFGSPATPKLSLAATSGGSGPAFPAVQLVGCEVLALTLGQGFDDPDNPKHTFSIPKPDLDIVRGVPFFVKHAQTLLGAMRQCLLSVGEQMEDALLHHIWYSTVAHIKNVLEVASKGESVDIFKLFLESYRQLVDTQALQAPKLLKLLQAILCLPGKVLASSSYNTADLMQGCPALYLMNCLFHHRILETGLQTERFYSALENLIGCGLTNGSGSLVFVQSAVELLDKAVVHMEDRETTWRAWSCLATPCGDHILKTSEVNQGNNIEHDFTAIYKVLVFPVKHIMSGDLPQPTMKTLMKSWASLYATFARLAAMVTNAEANIGCEELCAELCHVCSQNEAKMKDATFVDCLTQMLQNMTDNVEYSSIAEPGQFNFASVSPMSPSKMQRKRLRPLGNLHHLVMLVERTTQGVLVALRKAAEGVQEFGTVDSKKGSAVSHLQLAVNNLIHVLTTLFTHVTTSQAISAMIGRLGHVVGQVFEEASKKSGVNGKVFNALMLQKLEKLWLDIATSVQSRYNGVFDSEFLQQMAPLLAATFLHSRRQVKNQTIMLWNATFSHVSVPLTYPDSLKPILAKVKDKTPIRLPGWDAGYVTCVGETPVSQMSLGESQAPLPAIIGLPSPRKAIGSFINKPVSPTVRLSPLKAASKRPPASPGPARRQLTINTASLMSMKDDEFVVIKPSPRKRRVLTEHQKESLREKRDIPALYSGADASQDVSLMAQFASDTNMSSSMPGTPTGTPMATITPFPSFRSAKPPSEEQDNKRKPETPATLPSTLPADTSDTKHEESISGTSHSDKEVATLPRKRGRRSVRFAGESPAIETGAKTVSSASLASEAQGSAGDSEPEVVLVEDSEATEERHLDEECTMDCAEVPDVGILAKDSVDENNKENVESASDECEMEVGDSVIDITDTQSETSASVVLSSAKAAEKSTDREGEKVEEVKITLTVSPAAKKRQLKIDECLSSGIQSQSQSDSSHDNHGSIDTKIGSSCETLTEDEGSMLPGRPARPSTRSRGGATGTPTEALAEEEIANHARTRSGSLDSSTDTPTASVKAAKNKPLRWRRSRSQDQIEAKEPVKTSPNKLKNFGKSLQVIGSLESWFGSDKRSPDGSKSATANSDLKVAPPVLVEDTQQGSPRGAATSAAPDVLVEDTQQFSPTSDPALKVESRSKTQGQDKDASVAETPVKDPAHPSPQLDTRAAKPVEIASRNLFQAVLDGFLPTQDVPALNDSEDDLIPSSQTPPRHIKKSGGKKSPYGTPTKTDMSVSEKTATSFSPVVQIRKLSDDELLSYHCDSVERSQNVASHGLSKTKVSLFSEKRERESASGSQIDSGSLPRSDVTDDVSDDVTATVANQQKGGRDRRSLRLRKSLSLDTAKVASPRTAPAPASGEGGVEFGQTEGGSKARRRSHSVQEDGNVCIVEVRSEEDTAEEADAAPGPNGPETPGTSGKAGSESDVDNEAKGADSYRSPSPNPDIEPMDQESSEDSQSTLVSDRSRSRRTPSRFKESPLLKKLSEESRRRSLRAAEADLDVSASQGTSQDLDTSASQGTSQESQSGSLIIKRRRGRQKRVPGEADVASSQGSLGVAKQPQFNPGLVGTLADHVMSDSASGSSADSKPQGVGDKSSQESGIKAERWIDSVEEIPETGGEVKTGDGKSGGEVAEDLKREGDPLAQSPEHPTEVTPKTTPAPADAASRGSSKMAKKRQMSKTGSLSVKQLNAMFTKEDGDCKEEEEEAEEPEAAGDAGNAADVSMDSEDSLPLNQLRRQCLDSPADGAVTDCPPRLSDDSDEAPLTALSVRRSPRKVPAESPSIHPGEECTRNLMKDSKTKEAFGDLSLKVTRTSTPKKDGAGEKSGKKVKVTRSRRRSHGAVTSGGDLGRMSPVVRRLRSDGKGLRNRKLNRSVDSVFLRGKSKSPLRQAKKRHRSGHVMSRASEPNDGERAMAAPLVGESGKRVSGETRVDGDAKEKRSESAKKGEEMEQRKLQDTDKAGPSVEEVAPASEKVVPVSEEVVAPASEDEMAPASEEMMAPASGEEVAPLSAFVAVIAGGPEKPKFVSPLRSPPRKGKPFDIPETPTSANKSLLMLSRAGVILQRAKMARGGGGGVSGSPCSFRGRGPLSARPQKLDTSESEQRPGILKSPTTDLSPTRPGSAGAGAAAGATVTKVSPPPSRFRPIHVPRIYSPSASPSAGILRKRKMSDEVKADSPSPPSKQRRVCFNETVETLEIPSAQKSRVAGRSARLVGRGSPRPVNRCLDMPPQSLAMSPLAGGKWSHAKLNPTTSKITTDEDLDKQTATEVGSAPSMVTADDVTPPGGDEVETQSQCSIRATPDSQLASSAPVCAHLVGCSLPVAHILPQLTSTMWVTGLCQLMKAKNIRTVGDLCALTENDVTNLPIKTPKVATLRKAVQELRAQAPAPTVAPPGESRQGQGHGPEDSSQKPPRPEVEDPGSPLKEMEQSADSDLLEPEMFDDEVLLLNMSLGPEESQGQLEGEGQGQSAASVAPSTCEDLVLSEAAPQNQGFDVATQDQGQETTNAQGRTSEKARDAAQAKAAGVPWVDRFVALAGEMKTELSSLRGDQLVQVHLKLSSMMGEVGLALQSKWPTNNQ